MWPGQGESPTSATAGYASAIYLTRGDMEEQVSVSTIKNAKGATIDLYLTYHSFNADASHAQVDTVMGYGWTHSYNIFLFSQRGHIFRMDGDGRDTKYKRGAGGSYTPTYEYDAIYRLVKVIDPMLEDIKYEEYDAVGNLLKVIDREENETTYTYDEVNRRISW